MANPNRTLFVIREIGRGNWGNRGALDYFPSTNARILLCLQSLVLDGNAFKRQGQDRGLVIERKGVVGAITRTPRGRLWPVGLQFQ